MLPSMDGGINLFSAEDLSDEVDIMDTSIEIVAEVVHATLDDGLVIPEEDIVAGPSRVSNKRKVEKKSLCCFKQETQN